MKLGSILIPYYGGIDPEHNNCVLGVKNLYPELPVVPLYSCPYIDMARSILVKAAMDISSEWVLFIDHDILFDPSDVERIHDVLFSRPEIHMVGAPYSMRKPGGAMIGSLRPDPLDPYKPIRFYEGGALHPAKYTGMGFTAIRTSVFEKLIHEGRMSISSECTTRGLPELNTGFVDGIYPFFALMLVPEHQAYHGEDVSFCYRVTDAGMNVWLDTSFRIQHKGAYRYMLEDMGMVVPSVNKLDITPTPPDNKTQVRAGYKVDGTPACPPMVNT